mmetsp:Transcript_55298/g.131901  ORF Transcript_55298/g.131901 Transcript_55298/m.131901 type:complete len:403 (-) Transcript_55298:229-1437(-)
MAADLIVASILEADIPEMQRVEGLSTVKSMLIKIRDAPGEEKYRQIRKTNPAVQRKLFPACFDLLRAAGFEDDGEHLLYRASPLGEAGPELDLVLALIESCVPEKPSASSQQASASAPASSSTTSNAGHVASSSTATSQAAVRANNPVDSKRAQQQRRQEQAKAERAKAEASAQEQLAALRQQRRGRYQEEQDVALAQHLSSREGDLPFDAISALNASRGATSSIVTCTRCGTSLRYSASTRARGVLCPCGALLQPLHLRGQLAHGSDRSDLPIEPGEPVNQDAARSLGGPMVPVQGQNGERAMVPLYSVLQMYRQAEQSQQQGAEEETIQALPTRCFTRADAEAAREKKDDTDKACQICMEEYVEGDELKYLPCFHFYHAKCIDQWLQVNSICPNCRHKIS